uniref:SV2 related protein b n=1 Tax=Lates calcarifer TaxID=8187 RepID=A0A4W6CQV0_LATCA
QSKTYIHPLSILLIPKALTISSLFTETLTVDDVLEVIGFGKFQWKISLLTGLSWLGDAMEMMILSILGPQLHCEWRLHSYEVALLTSVKSLLPQLYILLILFVCKCLYTDAFFCPSTFAPVYGWLLVLRGLAGFGVGGAPQCFLCIRYSGQVVLCLRSSWPCLVMPTLGWKWLLILSALPMAIFVCFCFWLPESPRFDLLTGRREKAMATLARIAKDNGKVLPQGKITVCKQNDRGQIKDLFTPQYWRTTLLLWFIWFANAFSYYGIVLLTTELLQAEDSCGVCLYEAYFVRLYLNTLLNSLCSSFCCRTTLTIFIFIARAFISGGFQAVYVYTPEVYPTENRALAMGTSSAIARVGAMITPFVAQVLLGSSVSSALLVYCCCAVLAGIASLILPIETLGRALQESHPGPEARGQTSSTTT